MLVPLCVAGFAGCASTSERVSGSVTVDGEALAQGYITFLPLDGQEASQGTEIRDGRYELAAAISGRFRVLITTPPNASMVKKDGEQRLQVTASPKAVTPSMRGNSTTVEIRDDQRSLDFALQITRRPKS